MISISKQKHRIILLLILIGLLIKAYYTEQISVNNGLGWDGMIYADFTKNIIPYLKTHYINRYYVQRIGVPLLLHFVFSIFNIEFYNPAIISAYSFLNSCCILIGTIYFFKISNTLQLTRNEEILGFASLFYCFPVLTLSLFYPILMDIPAFTVGIIVVYFYLKRNIGMFFFMLFIGSFIYPTFIIMSILFCFKNSNQDLLPTGDKASSSNFKKVKLFASKINIMYLLFCFCLPLLLIYTFTALYYSGSFELIWQKVKSYPLETLFTWFSFCLALAYVVYLTNFPKSIFSIKKVLKSINLFGLSLAVLLYFATYLIIDHYSAGGAAVLTLELYLHNIISQAVQNPINFIVAHVFYFGITPLLLFFIRNDLKKEIIKYGFGMIAFFSIVVFFSVGNESRQLINCYPFLVFLMLVTLNKYWNVSLAFSLIYSAFCLALSHFWYSLDFDVPSSDYSNFVAIQKFPMQRFFMFQGPWVSDWMYKIHLSVFIFIFVLFFLFFKRHRFITKKDENVQENNA